MDQPMTSEGSQQSLEKELAEVRFEFGNQQQENTRLLERIKELEEAKSRKKKSGTQSDTSSHSSARNRRFMEREGEKEKALTTFDFEDFEDFFKDFKEEHYQIYFTQDNLEFESEFFSTFLKYKSKKVLDLAIKNAKKELEEDPQNLRKIRKEYLLGRLEEKFVEYPDCYCSAWEDWIDTINDKYCDKHQYTKGIYEELGDF